MIEQTERIAVPSSAPGGLDSKRSGHFGRCDLFTLIDINDGKIVKVSTAENPPHVEQGCLRPVNILAGNKVSKIIVGGIGGRPLQGFESVGISVYFGEGETVKDAVNAYLAGKLSQVRIEDTCGGH